MVELFFFAFVVVVPDLALVVRLFVCWGGKNFYCGCFPFFFFFYFVVLA